jgi:hypothetical protein
MLRPGLHTRVTVTSQLRRQYRGRIGPPRSPPSARPWRPPSARLGPTKAKCGLAVYRNEPLEEGGAQYRLRSQATTLGIHA